MLSQIKNRFLKDKTSKSALINLALKSIAILLTLVFTPLLLSYLGNEKYGLWSTILSVISWMNYCDVGIGHGLRNLLTKELTEYNYKEAQKSVSTAYVVLTAIAGFLLIITIICSFTLNWGSLFNTQIDMTFPMAISFLFICINFILALSNTLLYALQLSERVALRNCLIQIINICGIIILSKFTSGSLIWMSILFGCSTMVVYIWNTIRIFKIYSMLRPGITAFQRSKISEISNVGIKFFILQLDCIALYTVDNILITHLFGAEAVTPFNITYKVFNACYGFLAALIVPYWSKTTAAIAERDYNWVQNAVKKLNVIGGLFCLGYIFVAFAFKPLTSVWLGGSLDYPSGLVTVMCTYYCLYSIVTINIQFINGSGKINFQLFLLTSMAVLNIPFSIFLATKCQMGVVGIRLATTILMAVAAISFPINLYAIIKKLKQE